MRILTELDHDAYQVFIFPEIKEFPRSFGITPEETRKFPFSVGSNGYGFTIAEFDGDCIIAAATINRIQQRVRRSHVAWLQRMVVSRNYRRQGHGRQVLQAAMNQAKSLRALEQVKLCVMAGNLGAIALYEAAGFQRFSFEQRAVKYEDGYEDELQMIQYL